MALRGILRILCRRRRHDLFADSLIVAISDDITYAKARFRDPEVYAFASEDPFWTEVVNRERMAASDTRSG